jgi:endonuclease YncB( thermonuclease family)
MRGWAGGAWRRMSWRGRTAVAGLVVVGLAVANADDPTPPPVDAAEATEYATPAETPSPEQLTERRRTPSPTAESLSPTPSQSASTSPEPVVAMGPRGDGLAGLRTGTVARVVDGDTLDLDDGTRVRLAIVDTPEVHNGPEACGPEAAAFTTDQVLGLEVVLYRPTAAPATDPFGRVVAEVARASDGSSLNVALVEAGFGTIDERFVDEDPDLATRMRAVGASAAVQPCAAIATPASVEPSTEGTQSVAGGPHTGRTDGGWDCHAAYRECLPAHLSDLDCPEIGHQVVLLGNDDPWRLDGRSTTRDDGVGCESFPAWSVGTTYPYE